MEFYIKKIREDKDMTLKELSLKSGVSASHIDNIENGIKVPSITVLCKIARGLGIPCWKLYSCDDSDPDYLKFLDLLCSILPKGELTDMPDNVLKLLICKIINDVNDRNVLEKIYSFILYIRQ